MSVNQKTYFIDSSEIATRSSEVPLADFSGGLNKGGSCSGGIGINTGNPNPTEQDWPRPAVSVVEESQYIGGTQSGIFTEDETFGDTALVSFVQASGAVSAGAEIANVSGFSFVNRTGQDLVADDWAWGVANNP